MTTECSGWPISSTRLLAQRAGRAGLHAAPASRPARPARCSEKAVKEIGLPEWSENHHLRLLRRRLHLQGRDEGRAGRPHGAVEGRQGQSRPYCVKGRFAWGYATHRERVLEPMIRDIGRRALARGELGGGDRPHRRPSSAASRPNMAPQRDRRHHLVALHQRGDLPRPEAGPRRLRQQQCRYLRPGLPLADRLRPEDHLRHLGRHPGFRQRRARRRDGRDRRQPDRRPPGLRLADEAAPAPGREADRHRSAPDRHGPHPAYRGELSPAAEARHQRRGADRDGACRRHRRPGRRGLHRASAATWTNIATGPSSSPGPSTAPRRSSSIPASPPPTCAARRGSMRPAATARSITASASPSTARARPRSWRSPISPWRPAISAARASA